MTRITRDITFLVAAIIIAVGAADGQPPAKDIKLDQEIRAVIQELSEAAKRKDRPAYDRLIADGFTFIHSNGVTDTKKTWTDKAAAGILSIQQEGAAGEIQ